MSLLKYLEPLTEKIESKRMRDAVNVSYEKLKSQRKAEANIAKQAQQLADTENKKIAELSQEIDDSSQDTEDVSLQIKTIIKQRIDAEAENLRKTPELFYSYIFLMGADLYYYFKDNLSGLQLFRAKMIEKIKAQQELETIEIENENKADDKKKSVAGNPQPNS